MENTNPSGDRYHDSDQAYSSQPGSQDAASFASTSAREATWHESSGSARDDRDSNQPAQIIARMPDLGMNYPESGPAVPRPHFYSTRRNMRREVRQSSSPIPLIVVGGIFGTIILFALIVGIIPHNKDGTSFETASMDDFPEMPSMDESAPLFDPTMPRLPQEAATASSDNSSEVGNSQFPVGEVSYQANDLYQSQPLDAFASEEKSQPEKENATGRDTTDVAHMADTTDTPGASSMAAGTSDATAGQSNDVGVDGQPSWETFGRPYRADQAPVAEYHQSPNRGTNTSQPNPYNNYSTQAPSQPVYARGDESYGASYPSNPSPYTTNGPSPYTTNTNTTNPYAVNLSAPNPYAANTANPYPGDYQNRGYDATNTAYRSESAGTSPPGQGLLQADQRPDSYYPSTDTPAYRSDTYYGSDDSYYQNRQQGEPWSATRSANRYNAVPDRTSTDQSTSRAIDSYESLAGSVPDQQDPRLASRPDIGRPIPGDSYRDRTMAPANRNPAPGGTNYAPPAGGNPYPRQTPQGYQDYDYGDPQASNTATGYNGSLRDGSTRGIGQPEPGSADFTGRISEPEQYLTNNYQDSWDTTRY